MQESPGPNPDWFEENKFFLKKIKYIALKQAFKYFTTNRFRDAFCVSEEFEIFSCYNFFMFHVFVLYFVHVSLFQCCTFFLLLSFHLVLHSFHVAAFSCCALSMVHSFRIALSSCCTTFMFSFFRIALYLVVLAFVIISKSIYKFSFI